MCCLLYLWVNFEIIQENPTSASKIRNPPIDTDVFMHHLHSHKAEYKSKWFISICTL